MKKKTKKLVLNRESLRIIEDGALETAPGAATTTRVGASYCTPCYTTENVSPCVTS